MIFIFLRKIKAKSYNKDNPPKPHQTESNQSKMSNRFSALNENNDKRKSGDKKKENPRPNIFRQKPKQGSQPSKHPRNTRRGSANQFRKFSQEIPVKQEFKIEQQQFPTLTNNETDTSTIDKNNDTKELSYFEKITKQKEIQKEATKSDGWIILTRKTLLEMSLKPKIEPEPINEYYNKNAAKLITETRRQHREELNDILGDMSPYWNLPTEVEDDDDDDLEYDGYSEDEEPEYVDETW